MLLLFALLLNVLIRPYYRNERLKTIQNIAQSFKVEIAQNKNNQQSLNKLTSTLINSNVCAVIYNDKAQRLYFVDSLGQSCAFGYLAPFAEEDVILLETPQKAINNLKEVKQFSKTFTPAKNKSETLVYGQKIETTLANYYLFINSPLAPVESVVNFVFKQYAFIATFILAIAFIASFYLAKKISSPIIELREEANKLAQQNYYLGLPKPSFTEIDNLAKSLVDASKKLSKIEELRKDLLANISHDIKTPLTMIQAYAEMIRDLSGGKKKKREEHLKVILEEVAYLNNLINDIQELAQIKAGYIVLKKSNFELKEACLSVIKLLEQMAKDKGTIIVTSLDSFLIYADYDKIKQVIYNYVVNAIKHTANNSVIKIRCWQDEYDSYFEVIDNGEGIKEEDLPYIWDRYFKTAKTFHRQVNSSGLGLAIVKAIVMAHKGRYGVKSTYGNGASFYIALKRDYDEDKN